MKISTCLAIKEVYVWSGPSLRGGAGGLSCLDEDWLVHVRSAKLSSVGSISSAGSIGLTGSDRRTCRSRGSNVSIFSFFPLLE